MRPTVLRRALLIGPGEGRRTALAGLWFFLLLASYSILRPVRDAMGAAGGVRDLPWLWNATFLVSLSISPLFAWATARFPRRRFVVWSYRVVALTLLVCAAMWSALGDAGRLWLGRAFYVWVSVFNLFVVSVLWSVVTELFRTEEAKRTFGPIALGATLGAVTGSATTGLSAETVGIGGLLLVAAGLVELGLVFARALMRGHPAADEPVHEKGGDRTGGITALRGVRRIVRSRYLLAIAGYVGLLAFASTVLYFEKIRLARAAFDSYEARAAFFAWVDHGTQITTALLQAFVTGRLIRTGGLTPALCALPAVAALGCASMLVSAWVGWSMFAVLVAFDVLHSASRHAIARPAREVLFTTVDDEERYAAKNFVDTAVHRGGDVASAWGYERILHSLGGPAGSWLLALVPMVGWLVLGAWLGRTGEKRTRRAEPEDRTSHEAAPALRE